MRQVLTGCVLALAATSLVAAQDTTIRSETRIKADDAKVITLTGCLSGGPTTFTLTNAMPVEANKPSDKPIGTSGTASAYLLTPREGVTFAPHVGQKVEVSGVIVAAAGPGGKEAQVEVRERTEIRRDGAPDARSEATTKTTIARGATDRFSVASIKLVSPVCLQ